MTGANRTALFHALNMGATSRFAEQGGHHLNVIPLFWAGGLNTFTQPMLYWGGRVTTTRRFDESVALRLLSDPAQAITTCAARRRCTCGWRRCRSSPPRSSPRSDVH